MMVIYRYAVGCEKNNYGVKLCQLEEHHQNMSHSHGKALMIPSNATNAIAFAGNALRKQGTNPRQYALKPPPSLPTATAASFHRLNRCVPSFNCPPRGSVMMRCLMISEGYDVNQKIWADKPPAQKFMEGVDRSVCFLNAVVKRSYEAHQQKKNERKRSVEQRP